MAENENVARAFVYLRRLLVGSPPFADAEDAWMAARIDEAEAIARGEDHPSDTPMAIEDDLPAAEVA